MLNPIYSRLFFLIKVLSHLELPAPLLNSLHADVLLAVRAYVRLGPMMLMPSSSYLNPSASFHAFSRVGLLLLASDSVHFKILLLLRSCAGSKSVFLVFGITCLNSSTLSLDVISLGATLLLQGTSKSRSSLLALDLVYLKSLMILRSCSCFKSFMFASHPVNLVMLFFPNFVHV